MAPILFCRNQTCNDLNNVCCSSVGRAMTGTRPEPDRFETHLHGDQYEVNQSADSTETNSTELQQSWETQRESTLNKDNSKQSEAYRKSCPSRTRTFRSRFTVAPNESKSVINRSIRYWYCLPMFPRHLETFWTRKQWIVMNEPDTSRPSLPMFPVKLNNKGKNRKL